MLREKNHSNTTGYRQMHQRLLTKHKLVASRETVQKTISALDPAGVSRHSMKGFRHHVYSVRGPNDMWHIDGYDQLKKSLKIHRQNSKEIHF